MKWSTKWLFTLFKWLIRADYVEEVLGDIHEGYQRKTTKSKDLWLIWQLINLLRLSLLRPPSTNSFTRFYLLRFNMVFAIRNMKRNLTITGLNITGIAIGLTMCGFIGLYVLDELSYDQHWKDLDQIYRVYVDIDFGNTQARYANATAPMSRIFEEDFDDVLVAARWNNSPSLTFVHDDELFEEKKVIYADQDFFSIFQFDVIHGTTSNALTEPNTLVLTQTTSVKYFGSQNPVGEVLQTNSGEMFTVTCVIEDVPDNSHFEADMIRTTINDRWSDPSKVPLLAYWTSSAYRTYLKLRPGVDPKDLVKKFELIYPKYFNPVTLEFSGQSWDEFVSDGNRYFYDLQPLKDVYLKSNFQNDGLEQGDLDMVIAFSLIALLILTMAYTNFVNLTISRINQRTKEIGVKKVLGSTRIQLVKQLLLESVLISLISLMAAFVIMLLLKDQYETWTGKDFDGWLFDEHQIGIYLIAVSILAGFFSGIYPGWILSSHHIAGSLRNSLHPPSGSYLSRNLLVGFQHGVVVILLFGVLVVNRQLRFMNEKDLGYSRENLIVINNAWAASEDVQSIINDLVAIPAVSSVSAPSHVPGDLFFFGGMMYESNSNTLNGRVNCKRLWVDSSMVETVDMKLIAGRNFYAGDFRDSLSVVINQEAVKSLGLTGDPIGRTISFTDGKDQHFKVIGVVQDFHVRSLKSPMFAVALHQVQQPRRIVLKYNTQELSTLLVDIQSIWNKHVEDHVMDMQLGEERYGRFYLAERGMNRLLRVFVMVAIVIAIVGMIGLILLHTENRRKEIGIRRVLGASILSIVWWMGEKLAKPVFFGFLVAIPIGWMLMRNWLETFAYRLPISMMSVLFSAISVLGLVLALVSILSSRAARENPINNLRCE